MSFANYYYEINIHILFFNTFHSSHSTLFTVHHFLMYRKCFRLFYSLLYLIEIEPEFLNASYWQQVHSLTRLTKQQLFFFMRSNFEFTTEHPKTRTTLALVKLLQISRVKQLVMRTPNIHFGGKVLFKTRSLLVLKTEFPPINNCVSSCVVSAERSTV